MSPLALLDAPPSHGRLDVRASIVAERAGGGQRTRLRSDPPLVARRTGPAEVHLVGVGAAPVAGDRLHLDVRVAAGAALRVSQVAATLALPAPREHDEHARDGSRLTIDIEVGAGASLTWAGAPTVAVAGCHHLTEVRIRLAGDATLRWRDEVVAGRHGEPSGLLTSRLVVEREGVVLLRSATTVGDEPWRSAAVGGDTRVLGTVLLAGTAAGAPPPTPPDLNRHGAIAAAARLAEDLVLTQALADDHPSVRAILDDALAR